MSFLRVVRSVYCNKEYSRRRFDCFLLCVSYEDGINLHIYFTSAIYVLELARTYIYDGRLFT